MARKKTIFYETIEYIGPRPQLQKRRNRIGAWVIVSIAAVMGFWVGRPLIPSLRATQQSASVEEVGEAVSALEKSSLPGASLAAAALEYSKRDIAYDSSYYRIGFPMGDVAEDKGMAADVIVRSFRETGIDLQVELNNDIKAHFNRYPQLWNAAGADAHIDHRRVANLQRFFERNGEVLKASRHAMDYQPGDIVVWSLASAEKHIGIVVPGPDERAHEPWVIHHLDDEVRWENVLFDFRIEGHYRYQGNKAK
jgi:uncharacterized protein YijF (DUF1287 family)